MVTETHSGKCYFCDDPIVGKAVQWDESNNYAKNPTAEGMHTLYLHPKCAVSLAYRLVGDA